MNKELKIVLVLVITGFTMIVVGFLYSICEMVIEHECYSLPINEFYQNNKCHKYVEDFKNEKYK